MKSWSYLYSAGRCTSPALEEEAKEKRRNADGEKDNKKKKNMHCDNMIGNIGNALSKARQHAVATSTSSDNLDMLTRVKH